jgi:hypothetical protein
MATKNLSQPNPKPEPKAKFDYARRAAALPLSPHSPGYLVISGKLLDIIEAVDYRQAVRH